MAERSSRPPKSRNSAPGGGSSYGKKSYGGGGGRPEGGASYKGRAGSSTYGGKKEYGDKPYSGGGYKPRSEGSTYGGKKEYGDKPYSGGGYKPRSEGSTYGGKKEYGDRPQSGGGYKPRGEGSTYGGKKEYGDKPYSGGGYKPRSEGSTYGGKKEYGDKPYSGGGYKPRGEGSSYGGKQEYGDKPYSSGGYKPRSEGSTYGGKKEYGDKPYSSGGYKPRSEGSTFARKEYGDRPDGNRPYKERGEGAQYNQRSYNTNTGPGRTGQGGAQRSFRKESPARISEDMPGVREIEDWDAEPAKKAGEEDAQSNILFGRNVVRELLKSGRTVDRILIARGETDGSLRQLARLAREAGMVVTETARGTLDEMTMPFGHSGRPGNHQGIVALLPAVEYAELDDIFTKAVESGKPPFIIICDGITDPGNLGAVIRSVECFGAHGVVIPKRRSATLNAAAAKAASGAEEHVPVVRVPNLTATLAELKERGVWILGADMDGQPITGTDMKGPMAMVIGGEGEGLSKLIKQKCDLLVKIPMEGQVGSLNASVAAAVMMYEKNRQEKLQTNS